MLALTVGFGVRSGLSDPDAKRNSQINDIFAVQTEVVRTIPAGNSSTELNCCPVDPRKKRTAHIGRHGLAEGGQCGAVRWQFSSICGRWPETQIHHRTRSRIGSDICICFGSSVPGCNAGTTASTSSLAISFHAIQAGVAPRPAVLRPLLRLPVIRCRSREEERPSAGKPTSCPTGWQSCLS
jgi:hypothetical protein